ncbi:MAG: 3-isopropylmalate dehydrogenase [Oscillospiraceae bacterium]|nr:3-isopropylmalate dehydrogenase [Oscillospiraceae bacterium]
MNKNIAVIRGDGIGPEIMEEALKVLNKVAQKFGHEFTYTEVYGGGAALEKYGHPMPQVSVDQCLASDSVLLAAVGDPKFNDVAPELRCEKGLLKIRSEMGLYANVRPAKMIPQLADACPLRKDIADKGIDFVVVRELIGGIYFGKRKTEVVNGEKVASDEMKYSEHEIERIGRVAFDMARKRRKKVTSVDKANVLDSSRLWREVMHRVAAEYPDVEYDDALVDSTAMQIVRDPSRFDVMVTENLFGDILSDEASMITGSIGLIPSASLGEGTRGLYEPIHGSAPDIAGKNIANPIGQILSAAMMLRYSFDMPAEAQAIEDAVGAALDAGWRTVDIMCDGMKQATCSQMGDIIASYI